MSQILSIETSTKNCSVALARNGQVVAYRADGSEQLNHAEKLHVFIAKIMAESHVSFDALDAISVSEGPGSYTGLRIGVSTAKGLAYAKSIPLIAVNTLKAMSFGLFKGDASQLLIPMIDARRMEVFCAGFDGAGKPIFDTRAEILSTESFPEGKDYREVLYFGNGAEKCQTMLQHSPRFRFVPNVVASAEGMAALAHQRFLANNFVDLAYFEPFYLKDYVAGKGKKDV